MKVSLGANLSGRKMLLASSLIMVLIRAIQEGDFVDASRARSGLASLGIAIEVTRKPAAPKRGIRS